MMGVAFLRDKMNANVMVKLCPLKNDMFRNTKDVEGLAPGASESCFT